MNLYFFHADAITDYGALYFNSTINISLWVFLITIGKMLIDKIQTQQQLELLEKERIKNELDYLKAQINPHALFNALNTIYGHIDKSNQIARNILLQFSELLRYQLYDCSTEKINLQKEITYIKNYIDFQRLRKDDQLIVDVKIGEIEPMLMIAPLLLVVIIENAFKFVSSFSDQSNKINISIYSKDGILHSLFGNTKEKDLNANHQTLGGIGIANLKRRLTLLYPNKFEFKNNITDEFYETSLIIDLT